MSEGRAADNERDAVTAAEADRGEADTEVAAVRPGESDAATAANVCRGDGEREACVGQSAPLWPWARQRKQRPAGFVRQSTPFVRQATPEKNAATPSIHLDNLLSLGVETILKQLKTHLQKVFKVQKICRGDFFLFFWGFLFF